MRDALSTLTKAFHSDDDALAAAEDRLRVESGAMTAVAEARCRLRYAWKAVLVTFRSLRNAFAGAARATMTEEDDDAGSGKGEGGAVRTLSTTSLTMNTV